MNFPFNVNEPKTTVVESQTRNSRNAREIWKKLQKALYFELSQTFQLQILFCIPDDRTILPILYSGLGTRVWYRDIIRSTTSTILPQIARYSKSKTPILDFIHKTRCLFYWSSGRVEWPYFPPSSEQGKRLFFSWWSGGREVTFPSPPPTTQRIKPNWPNTR